jgi:hypothetical protein
MDCKKVLEDICVEIMEIPSEFYDDSNGPYYAICPLCGARLPYSGNEKHKTISDIKHHSDCLRVKAIGILKHIQAEEE